MILINKIPQLKDNYSYAISFKKKVIIIDPAESLSILEYIIDNKLTLKAILITHHHEDHTGGVEGILNKINAPVYSPDKTIKGTTIVLKDEDIVDLDFIKINVISTPGHTTDHIVFYNKKNNLLFSGDTLFRLGCGRVFEGTYEQMFTSLQKIYNLNDKTTVYCGHEYTNNNLNFLLKIFPQNKSLLSEKNKIDKMLLEKKSTIPFNLGVEKTLNPFLSPNSNHYSKYKDSKNLSSFELFEHLRDLKNDF